MEQEVHVTFGIILAILGGCIAVIGWGVRSKVRGYDLKHDKHFDAIGDLQRGHASNEQAMVDHLKHDDERFGRVEGRIERGFEIIHTDIKEILSRLPK